MKDRVFSGPDVEEALAVAAASLGLPRAELRYVVLDAGDGGRARPQADARRGSRCSSRSRAAAGRRAADREPAPAAPRARPPGRPPRDDPRRGRGRRASTWRPRSRRATRPWSCASTGADAAFFLGEDGRGEVLRATEHLLQRLYGAALQPRALRLTCEGFRERRDEALADEARRLAEAVRADGQPRTMEPLNAYERRVVHVALQAEPGVTTYSVGEGADRRVTVAPAGPGDRAGGAATAASEHRAALEALGLGDEARAPPRRLPRHPRRLEPDGST